jgi:hypothetical protein
MNVFTNERVAYEIGMLRLPYRFGAFLDIFHVFRFSLRVEKVAVPTWEHQTNSISYPSVQIP